MILHTIASIKKIQTLAFFLPPKIQPVDHPLAVVLEDEVGGVVGVAFGGVDLVYMYPPDAQELGGLGLAQADALGSEEFVVCPKRKAADAALAEIALLARHDVAAAARAFAYDLAVRWKPR